MLTLNGIDHRSGTPQECVFRKFQWRRLIDAAVSTGGSVEVVNHFTTVRGRDGSLLFEVEGDISLFRSGSRKDDGET
jgi:hypothetical protein